MDPDLVVRTPLTREAGHAAARDLLSRPDRPTAVFAASDLQAIGVCRAADEPRAASGLCPARSALGSRSTGHRSARARHTS